MKKIIYISICLLLSFLQQAQAQGGTLIPLAPDHIEAKSEFDQLSTATNLIDGDVTSFWRSKRGTPPTIDNPAWVQFTFNEAQTVQGITLVSTHSSERRNDPLVFLVVGSHDATSNSWEVLYQSDNTIKFDAASQSKDFSFSQTEAFPYYRLVITKCRASYLANTVLAEVQLKGSLPNVTHIPYAVSARSPYFDDKIGENLFDEDPSTYWQCRRNVSLSPNNPEWIHFTYASKVVLNEVRLTSTGRQDRRNDPKNFKIIAWNDETDSTLLYERNETTQLFSNPQEELTFPLNNAEAFTSYGLFITGKPATYISNVALAELTFKGPQTNSVKSGEKEVDESQLSLKIYQIKVSVGHASLVVVRNTDTGEVLSSTLIDAGNESSDGRLIARVIKDIADSRLDYVFITHYDKDHYLGLIGRGGLLELRCKDGNIDEDNIVPSNPTANRLTVYAVNYNNTCPAGKVDKNNYIVPKALCDPLKEYEGQNKLTVQPWKPDTKLPLGGSVQFISLAVNGTLREGGTRDNLTKNNRSGVALITWGDFSFLIQGDMEGAKSKGQIARTNTYYWPNLANQSKRIPANWNQGTGQLAKDITFKQNMPWAGSLEGIVRESLGDMDKAGLPITSPLGIKVDGSEGPPNKRRKVLNQYYYKYYIAHPNPWLHQLGNTIDNHNGKGGYAQVSVALIPHHGALTSNLWFDSKHGIISCNAAGNHGHPNAQAVEAAYHTAGISDFYFTYLKDGFTHHGKTLNRLTEITNWKETYISKNPFLHPVDFHILGTSDNYFKIEVKDEVGQKMFRINNGTENTGEFISCYPN